MPRQQGCRRLSVRRPDHCEGLGVRERFELLVGCVEVTDGVVAARQREQRGHQALDEVSTGAHALEVLQVVVQVQKKLWRLR